MDGLLYSFEVLQPHVALQCHQFGSCTKSNRVIVCVKNWQAHTMRQKMYIIVHDVFAHIHAHECDYPASEAKRECHSYYSLFKQCEPIYL